MIPNGSIHVAARRVLVVENSPADRQLLRTWLHAESIETHFALDIVSALAACAGFQPNLILLQLRLPTYNGFEIIRRLKDDHRTRNIPVIFLAHSAMTAEKARGIDLGAVDFVSKPFDPVELLARVHSALRTKALLDLLEQRAHLDGLTELANRYALRDALPSLAAACRLDGRPLTALMTDLDHFKRVNDSHGHAAGDEVLRRTALVLRSLVREGDFLARYGGEEFVMLCPDCDRAAALKLAERVRQAVAGLQVSFRDSTIVTSASVGLATLSPPFPENPEEIIEQADRSMYRAKGGGRNAVWAWDPATAAPAPAPPPDADRIEIQTLPRDRPPTPFPITPPEFPAPC